MKTPRDYIPGVTCPACESKMLYAQEARNCFSRFCHGYICVPCGTKEAFEGFFWWQNALKRGFALNLAGQEIVQDHNNRVRR